MEWMIMLRKKAKLFVTKYLREHWLTAAIKVCLTIYVVYMMLSLEAKSIFSVEGFLLVLAIMIVALIIDSIYYSYQNK